MTAHSAEQKAKEIAVAIRDAILTEAAGKFDLPDGDLLISCPDSNAMIDCMVVAAAVLPAILEAENAKLEEAARAVNQMKLPPRWNGDDMSAGYAEAKEDASELIRSLISKKKPVDLVGVGTAALERGLNSKPKD